MSLLKRSVLSSVICLVLPAVSWGSGMTMPWSRDIVINCAIKMGQALDQVSPQEMDMAKGNGAMVKDMVVKTVVKPFTTGGYDFDSSAYKIIDKVNTQSLPRDDMEFVQAILFLYKSIGTASPYLYENGYMTERTFNAITQAGKTSKSE